MVRSLMLNPNLEDELDGSIIDDIEGGRFLVHRRVFTDPEIFRLEQERVFNHCWLYLGHEAEFAKPGDFRLRKAAGRSVILVRSVDDGKIRGFLNTCTHRGTAICHEANGTAKFFRCPYHAWTFNTSGDLTAVPLEDAYGPDGLNREAHALKQVPRLENYRGFIFVSFDKNIESLESYLRDAKEYLDFVCDQAEDGWELMPGTHRYSMRANWKLIVENSADNYHFVILHHRQVQHMKDVGVELAPYGALNLVSNGRSLKNGHGVTEHQQIASFGRLAGKWGGNLPQWAKEPLDALRERLEERFGKERAYRLAETNRNTRFFPNLYVLDHISPVVRIITPIAVDYTEIQEFTIAPRGERADIRELRLHNNNLQVGPAGFIAPEDVEVLERTQLGLANPEMEWCNNSRGLGVKPPRAISSDEQQMRGLHRHWHELITLGRVKHPIDL
jgi:p-cumate 2,3-dioxygenase subunit alpha